MNRSQRFGPWTTSLDAGRLELSAFWRRRMRALAELPTGWRSRRRWIAAAVAAGALLAGAPLVEFVPAAAQATNEPTGSQEAPHAPLPVDRAAVPGDAAFGPVEERTVNDERHGGYMIDFDSGKVFEEPEDQEFASQREKIAWMRSQGIDAMGEVSASYDGLLGFDMVALPTSADSWDTRPGAVVENLEFGDLGTPALMDARGGLPATYFIRTREGARGVLQITGRDEANDRPGPDRLELRFKLVATPTKRVVFRPGKPGAESANWSPLFRMREGDGDYLLLADVPVGGKFPVRLAGTEVDLFSVELASGTDDALRVLVTPPTGESQRLSLERDQPVDVLVGDEKYTLVFPTSEVAPESNAATAKAHIMMTWRPKATDAGKTAAPASPAQGAQVETIMPGEYVVIEAASAPPDHPIQGRRLVEPGAGRVSLGPLYGRVTVGGLTLEEAEQEIARHLAKWLREPHVGVTFPVEGRTAASGPANAEAGQIMKGAAYNFEFAGTSAGGLKSGPRRVEASGSVSLGPPFGRINVAGLTFDEAEAAIRSRLVEFFREPLVAVTPGESPAPATR
jgi:protein involved in polysaccharide export with SLBB domain